MTHWTEHLSFLGGLAPVRCTGTGVPGLVAHRDGSWRVSHVASGMGLGPSFDTLYELHAAVDTARDVAGYCNWGDTLTVNADGVPVGSHGRWLTAFRRAAGWRLVGV